MDGLLIREPWIDKIFEGKKTWEIRSRPTNKRGRIALIKSGTGLVYGTVELVDCRRLTLKEYRASRRKHCTELKDTRSLPCKTTYAWILKDPVLYRHPHPYKHPYGAVVWVKLNKKPEK